MQHLRNWDNKTWLSTKKYILSFNKFLNKIIKFNRSTKILDIGCGRANIISFLNSKYKFIIDPIGIDIIKNNDLRDKINFKKEDAVRFLNKTDKTFDLILIKQTIHFFSKKKIKKLLGLSKLKLRKNGKILIFFLEEKNNEIPCFRHMKMKLKKSFDKDSNIERIVKKELRVFTQKKYSFKVSITKRKYIQMLKNRYISCLLQIPKSKILKGINEISNRYSNKIVFNDKLRCLIYQN